MRETRSTEFTIVRSLRFEHRSGYSRYARGAGVGRGSRGWRTSRFWWCPRWRCCRCRGCRSGSRCHCGRGCSWRRSWSSPCLAEKFHRGHRNGGTVVAARQPNPRCAVRVGGEVAPCSRERRDGRTRCPSVSAGVVNVLSPDSACTKNPIAKIAASQKIDRAALDILMLLVPFSAPACEFHCVESQLTLCGSVVMVEVQVWDAA
jgi:hypothetical protein